MNSSLADREPNEVGKIDQHAIREELERVLESSIFVQSDRLTRFLRFTVEMTLAGEGAALKEYLIGTEVYDRKPPYHPSVDSIVRSEARRLRSKLRQYYESAGQHDPVFIYYRTGSYVPVFRFHCADNHTRTPIQSALKELLGEGLITQTYDLGLADRKVRVQIIFEGTVRIVRSNPEPPTAAPLAPVQSILRPSSIPKVVSVSAGNVLKTRPSSNARTERRSFSRTRKATRFEEATNR